MNIGRRKKPSQGQDLARTLMSAVVLRYRADGHVRFDLPEPLTRPGPIEVLRRGLPQCEGVYRVDVYRRPAKLSLRFDTAVCGERDVVRALAALIADIAEHIDDLSEPEDAPRGFVARFKEIGPIKRLRARYLRVKQQGSIAARVIGAKMGLAQPLPFDAREWVMNFLNDLVAFYLIKLHWERITKQWLFDPIKYRYQWGTVIYLVFLLVQSRKARK